MKIDHIFIFSDREGAEADELLAMGFREGSSRIHAGQGTRNRKFYFQDFFLEILWVHDVQEIQSSRVRPSHLWEHAQFGTNGASPFGLCLVPSSDTELLFENGVPYFPAFLPEGMPIVFFPDESPHLFPVTFQLPPALSAPAKYSQEPVHHQGRMNRLTNVQFTVPIRAQGLKEKEYPSFFQGSRLISFVGGLEHQLSLTFDDGKQGQEIYLPDLKLSLKY